VLLSNLTPPALDSKGRFFAAAFDRYQVVVFNPDGRLARLLGQKGEGPGEFDAAVRQIVVAPGDSVYVFHGRGQVTVFSPQLIFVRRVTVPTGSDMRVAGFVDGGGLLMRGPIRTPERAGHPYHLVSINGEVERSFGYDGKPVTPAGMPAGAPPLRVSRDGKSLWGLSPAARYDLVRWNSEGALLDSIEVVAVPWLQEPVPDLPARTIRGWGGTGTPVELPKPTIGVHMMGLDSAGLVWVGIRKPIGYDQASAEYRWSLRVEAFDPVSREVAVSRPFDTFVMLFDGTNYAYSTSGGPTDAAHYTLWRLRLRGFTQLPE
jgi:hypothetical protein